jgi:hypothetical protein
MEWRNASMRAPDSLVCVEAGAEGSDDKAEGRGEERNEGGLTEEGTSGLRREEEDEERGRKCITTSQTSTARCW